MLRSYNILPKWWEDAYTKRCTYGVSSPCGLKAVECTSIIVLPKVADDPALRCGKCGNCAGRASISPLSFAELTELTLTSDEQTACKTSEPTINIRAFDHKLYSCQKNGTIEVFTHDLIPMYKWIDSDWGDVNDVTELQNKQIAVAGSKGLFLVSAGGWTVRALLRGLLFSSCVVIEERLFACCNSLQQIFVYELTDNRWMEANSIHREIARRSRVKLAVSETNTIIYGYSNSDIICEISTDGTSIPERDIGSARDYLLCSADAEGAILAIDKKKGCLKVCSRSDDWTELNLRPPVKSPQSAVVIKGKLCVAADDGERLVLCTSEVE